MPEDLTPMNTHHEYIWREVLHLHNIHTPLDPKVDVIGFKPGRWRKFNRVKGHHIEDFFQLKNKIERLLQERHLNKYVKEDSSHSSEKSNPRGHGDDGSPKSNKAKEEPHGESSKVARHTLNTIAGRLSRGRETIFAQKRYAYQILSVENIPEVKT